MDLAGKKAIILVGPKYDERELFYPQIRLKEAGAMVKFAGIGEKKYESKVGMQVEVDGQCEDFVNEKWDAVIVPGGWAPDKIRGNKAALDIVRKAMKEGAVVAAICHAGWVLASAEVVRGKKLTSYKNIKDDLVNAGAEWVDEEVVVDGNLITSRNPDDLPAFGRELVRAMAKVGAAR